MEESGEIEAVGEDEVAQIRIYLSSWLGTQDLAQDDKNR